MRGLTSGVLIFSSFFLMMLFNLKPSKAINVEFVKFNYKTNMKYGNLSFDGGNATHISEITYVLFKDVKNLQLHLVFKQINPEIVIFEKNFNMCFVAQLQSGNIFTKEFFKNLLQNLDFVVKCPFKKGIYKRTPSLVYTVNSTELKIPTFITYEKEFLFASTYSTRVNGRIEDIAQTEGTFRLVH